MFLSLGWLEEIVFRSNNFEILKLKDVKPSRIVIDSKMITELPSLHNFTGLINLTILDNGIPVLFPSNFIYSHNISIYVHGNIDKIPEDAFVGSNISEFVYCGNNTVQGNFLKNAHSCNSVQCSSIYKPKKFGGKSYSINKDICPEYERKMSEATKVAIIVAVSAIIIGIIITLVLVLKVNSDHKFIKHKLLLQKLVVEDFG